MMVLLFDYAYSCPDDGRTDRPPVHVAQTAFGLALHNPEASQFRASGLSKRRLKCIASPGCRLHVVANRLRRAAQSGRATACVSNCHEATRRNTACTPEGQRPPLSRTYRLVLGERGCQHAVLRAVRAGCFDRRNLESSSTSLAGVLADGSAVRICAESTRQ